MTLSKALEQLKMFRDACYGSKYGYGTGRVTEKLPSQGTLDTIIKAVEKLV